MMVDFDVREQQMKNFFTGGNIIMESYFGQKQRFEVKMLWWICFL